MNIFCKFDQKNKMKKLIFLSFVFCLIFSCSSKKQILYIQDSNVNDLYSTEFLEYKVQIDDILKIQVLSVQPELESMFNITNEAVFNTESAVLYNGYKVDSEGFITLPQINKLYVKGSTLIEIRSMIESQLIQLDLLIEPNIDIKLVNSYFTILGEVKLPGRYNFLENNLNIFEAIGMAGDLSINGLRKDVKLIREINGEQKILSIDLTSSTSFTSNVFQVFSGDIIIVNPNSSRIKNAGIIGNSGTLISLLSFLLSSIIVINN